MTADHDDRDDHDADLLAEQIAIEDAAEQIARDTRRWPCCDQRLTPPADTCLLDDDRHPYGREPMYAHLRHQMPDRCRDCAVTVGGLHHDRCCVAQCRTCGGQALCCDGKACA